MPYLEMSFLMYDLLSSLPVAPVPAMAGRLRSPKRTNSRVTDPVKTSKGLGWRIVNTSLVKGLQMLRDKVGLFFAFWMFTVQRKHMTSTNTCTCTCFTQERQRVNLDLKPRNLSDELRRFSSLPCFLELSSLRCLKISARYASFAHHCASAILSR